MRRSVVVILGFAIAYAVYMQQVPSLPQRTVAQTPIAALPPATGQWRSGQQVSGSGTVSRVLSDDNEGSRHQRFILELEHGGTLLVAHNIDLAPRIPSLRTGDRVAFYGEYETNPQGGVVHWTHRDPQGRHTDGWLEHNGQRYQ